MALLLSGRRTARRAARFGAVLLEVAGAFLLWLTVWLLLWVVVPTLVAGLTPIAITSGSMGPIIARGDVVLVRDAPTDEQLGPGTVITFKAPVGDGLVTHRIEQVRDDGTYRTRGDANLSADSSPVAPSDVVGVGVLLVPFVALPRLWWEARSVLLLVWLAIVLGALVVTRAAPAPPDLRVDGPAGRAEDEVNDVVAVVGAPSGALARWLVDLPGWAIPTASGLVALALVALWSLV